MIMDLRNKTILVVEDEDFSFMFINEILIQEKAKVLRAKTGKEAVEICKENSETINLVLMDIQLPVMDGWQATKEILKYHSNLPIIAQTAYAMKKQKDKCFESGCIDYIAKPYDNQQLLELISLHI